MSNVIQFQKFKTIILNCYNIRWRITLYVPRIPRSNSNTLPVTIHKHYELCQSYHTHVIFIKGLVLSEFQ